MAFGTFNKEISKKDYYRPQPVSKIELIRPTEEKMNEMRLMMEKWMKLNPNMNRRKTYNEGTLLK